MNKNLWAPVLLLAFHLFTAYSQLTIDWLNIDCGNNALRWDKNLLQWVTDNGYTQAGINKQVPQKQELEEMNTLRSFPNKAQQNCYALPFSAQTQRFLVRAGFYYGNYDGLSKPPSFDIHINGRNWSTVNTSTVVEGPIYHEAMYVNQGAGSLNVCIVQDESEVVPFISSIEAVPIWVLTGPFYREMETNYAYNLVSRINYGGGEVRFPGGEEMYNRVWTRGTTPPNCTEVATLPAFLPVPENDPPNSVLSDSIESMNPADPITLSIHLPQTTPQSAYIVLYFTETVTIPKPDDTRIIQIYINGQMKSTVTTENIECKVMTIYPVTVVGPTINVTLASAKGSTLPPIISAMEVFTRIEANKGDKSSSPPPSSPSHGTQGHFFYAYINSISCICLLLLFIA
ncbi:probable LRR receptor-like serine/threonine-protein kinase MEE39 [Prunus avium]|uniref:Probable LRR receptor-like serine/threonine-protein kinase MEE39 n=1 Tax=Prunus avium TaxID=42229 RepID=A0A6P5SA19_PRUAV|nr:probable LRR receptor-like serine/threonine-protein kinase MEE39 [Prunus avium]